MLIEGLQLWLAGTNSWVVAPSGPGGECVLIDAPPEPGAILGRIRERELRLVALFATHGHADHVGGVADVVGGVEQPVDVHFNDADRHLLLDPSRSNGTLGRLLEVDDISLGPPELVHGLDDGQRVSGAGMTFTALHTPGHTKGSTCFLLDVDGEQPVIFTGDHLFAGSIGRFDLAGGSRDELMTSMAEKILPLDDSIRVLPGHGPTTTIGQERRSNPYISELTGSK